MHFACTRSREYNIISHIGNWISQATKEKKSMTHILWTKWKDDTGLPTYTHIWCANDATRASCRCVLDIRGRPTKLERARAYLIPLAAPFLLLFRFLFLFRAFSRCCPYLATASYFCCLLSSILFLNFYLPDRSVSSSLYDIWILLFAFLCIFKLLHLCVWIKYFGLKFL